MYAPLREKEIRLLHVEPGPFHDPIICNLETISLDRKRAYRALSYVWGDPLNRREITVDGHVVLVTVNLELALRRLRAFAAGEAITLWLDAVCIDQVNVHERGEQVAMMGTIYSRCSEVCIWLGAFGYEDDPACLDRKVLEPSDRTDDSPSQQCPQASAPTGLALCARAFLALAAGSHIREIAPDTEQLFQSLVDAMTELAECAWFDRAWIVQEAYLAPQAKVYFGNVALSSTLLFQSFTRWRPLQTDCPCCRALPEEFRPILAPLQNFLPKLRMLVLKDPAVVGTTQPRSVWTQASVGLLEYTLEHRKHKCADPRDHIYAFQGIITSWLDEELPRPDYTGDKADLYLRVCADAVLKGGTLTFLGWNNTKNECKNLPSWAMDWTSDYLPDEVAWIEATKKWNSAKGIKFKAEILGRTTLVARGLKVDAVARVGRLFEDGMQLLTDEELWADWHEVMRPTRESNNSTYPSGVNWRDAWWKALCFDSANSEFKRTEREIRAFELVATVMPIPVNFTEGVSPECLAMDFDMTRDSIIEMFQFTTQKIWGLLPLVLVMRRLFVTENGYLGWARDGIQVGDPVFLLGGCSAPLVMHETGKEFSGADEFDGQSLNCCPIRELVSGAYIYGIMDGEVIQKMGSVVPEAVCIE